MNDDLINTKVQIERKMDKALKLLPKIFDEYAQLSGRRYGFLDVYGDPDAPVAMFVLNSAGGGREGGGGPPAPGGQERQGGHAHRPAPLARPTRSCKRSFSADRIMVAERVSQYGAGNYLANEIGAVLQRSGNSNLLLSRTYGIGGLNFYPEDAEYLFRAGAQLPQRPGQTRSAGRGTTRPGRATRTTSLSRRSPRLTTATRPR